jgi:hypothetical protein
MLSTELLNNPAVSTANTPAFVAKHTPLYLDSVNHRQASVARSVSLYRSFRFATWLACGDALATVKAVNSTYTRR